MLRSIAFFAVLLWAFSASAGEWPITSPGTLYVMNKRDNTVTLISLDSGKSLSTLATGVEPHEGAASPDGRWVVISNTDYGSDSGHTLTVVDAAANRVARTIKLGYANPHGITFIADGRALVTVEGNQAVVLVNVDTGEVDWAISTSGFPCHMVAASPDGKRAYATSISAGALVVLDLEAGEMTGTVATGDGAEGLDLSADGKEVWVGNRGEDTIAIVDTETLNVERKLDARGVPIRLKFARDGEVVLVSSYRTASVLVFDYASRVQIGTIAMQADAAPIGILVAPDQNHAFIANTRSNIVTVIDTRELTVKSTLRAGNTPDGLAWTVAR